MPRPLSTELRAACEAFVKSRAAEGWVLLAERYDDGGLSGGTLERPALQRLLSAIEAAEIDIVVVYRGDRLTRSLADFARTVELFDARGVSLVSVTQQFNTTTSMGRLTIQDDLPLSWSIQRSRYRLGQASGDARPFGKRTEKSGRRENTRSARKSLSERLSPRTESDRDFL